MRILMFVCFFYVLGMFQTNAQDFDSDRGTYCTIEDQKYNVFIFKDPNDCKPNSYENFIQCKSTTNSDTVWIESSSLKWFTVLKNSSSQTDSFVVSRSSVFKDHGFVQVLLDGKHYKIYHTTSYNRVRHSRTPIASSYMTGHFTTMPAGKEIISYSTDSRDLYFFGTEPNNLTEITRSIFSDIMQIIMADKPDVVKAITKKEFIYGQLYALISYYKTGIKPPK